MARINILEGKESTIIAKLAMPMVLGLLSVIGVSLVDAYFIGMIGTNELVAFGFIFPAIFAVNGIALGIGSGTSTLVAKAVGAGDTARAKQLLTDAILLGALLMLLITILGELTIDPFFTMLGANHETLPLVRDFMHIWYAGAIFAAFPMISVAALVALGNTKTASRLQMNVMLGNVILDPVFAFGLSMGFRGIALAIIVSRIFVLFYAFYVLAKVEKMICFDMPSPARVFSSWKQILYIGVPNTGTNLILPIGFGIITHLAAKFGKEAVAAVAVAERVESLSLVIFLAVANSMAPFVGQNVGAGNVERIRTGTRKAMQFTQYWGLVMLAGLYLFADKIILLFNSDPKVIELFTAYFHIVPFSYVLVGSFFVAQAALNAFIMPFHASMLVITRVFILYVPLALFFTSIMGVKGIFYSAFAANILASIFGLIVFKVQSKKMFNKILQKNI